jgi:hypothetical protein
MHHLNVELIMGHKTTGTQETYWRPTEEEVLQDYLQAVPLLTVGASSADVKKEQQRHLQDIEELRTSFDNLKKYVNQLMVLQEKREQNDKEMWQYIETMMMKNKKK